MLRANSASVNGEMGADCKPVMCRASEAVLEATGEALQSGRLG